LPRKRSQTGHTEIIKKYWESLTGLKTGNRTYKRTLCQKNEGALKIKQKPATASFYHWAMKKLQDVGIRTHIQDLMQTWKMTKRTDRQTTEHKNQRAQMEHKD
jgi:hypothetical protein